MGVELTIMPCMQFRDCWFRCADVKDVHQLDDSQGGDNTGKWVILLPQRRSKLIPYESSIVHHTSAARECWSCNCLSTIFLLQCMFLGFRESIASTPVADSGMHASDALDMPDRKHPQGALPYPTVQNTHFSS